MSFVLVVLALCAASCLSAPADTRYVDSEHQFSVMPPSGWTVNKTLIPHYAVFVEPNKSPQDEAATIGTFGEPIPNLTLEQYLKATRKGIAAQKGLSVYDEKTVTLGGAKAYSWRMRINLPGQTPHENRQAFCAHGSQAVILTLTALPATIKKYDAAFDKTLASFQWEQAPAPSGRRKKSGG
jgi:hypothetical protein